MTVESPEAKQQKETHAFQTEARQILDLMIHSLYSNKEIFLRELISNASDACDKLRFEALADESLYGDQPELKIRVDFDQEAGTLTIADTGIGMSRDEIIDNIGTIARSGTRKFLESLTGDQKADAQLIGQFGVGFYSAFIVADKVTLISRRAGSDEAWRWESDGQGEFTLEPAEKAERGTEVILHLREEDKDFLDDFRLRDIIHRYSDHIGFPIEMRKRGEEENKDEWEVVNEAKALWTLPKNEIKDEEYKEFYKHVSHDFADPLLWSHNRVEGNQSYTTLLYVPEKAPFDLFLSRDEGRKGLKLYVRRVFIMDAAEQLLPLYLRFVRGVVDSDDLPLNVSREILQENKLVKSIRAGIVKRVLDMLSRLAKDDAEKYATFWNNFGEVLKEGIVEDMPNQGKVAKLLRFASTLNSDDAQTVSLDDYLSRMKPEQEKIYYLTADSWQAAIHSPHLEAFRKKGIEVLLLTDRVDEWMMGYFREYEGKPFQSIAKGDVDLGKLEDEKDKAEREAREKAADDLPERIQKVLEDKVSEVKVSHLLEDSPACLMLDEHDMAVHMQKLLQQAGHGLPASKPRLEINPLHPLLQRMKALQDEAEFSAWANLLFEQALLAEGGQLDDPAGFVQRMNRILLQMEQPAAAGDQPAEAQD